MKIAILMLCHKNPQQINMFLDAMKHPAIEFFIHVDKKADIVEEIEHREDIHFLPENDRVSVEWGGWNLVQAELNLFNNAIACERFDYYWLCSGQDFPIKSVDEIVTYFSTRPNSDFVNLYDSYYTNGGHTNKYDKRTAIKFPDAVMGTNITKRITKRLLVEITGGYNHTFKIFQRKNITGMRFYFGSQWICFSNETLRWIQKYVSENKNYNGYFRYVNTPDECYFQTLFMNSPYKEKRRDYLHYIDWSSGGNSPKTLTIDDLQKIEKSEYLMARKFDRSSFDLLQEIMKDLV